MKGGILGARKVKGRVINGGMFGRLHNSVWETLQDATTESSEGCGETTMNWS